MDTERNLSEYLDSPSRQRGLFKRTAVVVMLSQLLAGAGLIAGISVGALLAQELLGSASLIGLPLTLTTLGSALTSYLGGRFTQRFGRRWGLSVGFLIGGLGAFGIFFAVAQRNLVLFFFFLFIYGAGSATGLLARYAGTDLARPKERATAIGMALFFTSFGALLGPLFTNMLSNLALSLGASGKSGVFLLASVAYILAGLAVFIFLRPDPLFLANALAKRQNEAAVQGEVAAQGEVSRRDEATQQDKAAKRTTQHVQSRIDGSTPTGTTNMRGVVAGIIIMGSSQMVMVLIMTMTPVQVEHHGHSLNVVSWIISLHIAGMYLPSLVSGIFIDRVGRRNTTICAGLILMVAGILAATASSEALPQLTIALILLGVGWNLGFVSGTAMLVDFVAIEKRARFQGTADVFLAAASAIGSFTSGIIVAASNYATLSLIGVVISAAMIVYVTFFTRRVLSGKINK